MFTCLVTTHLYAGLSDLEPLVLFCWRGPLGSQLTNMKQEPKCIWELERQTFSMYSSKFFYSSGKRMFAVAAVMVGHNEKTQWSDGKNEEIATTCHTNKCLCVMTLVAASSTGTTNVPPPGGVGPGARNCARHKHGKALNDISTTSQIMIVLIARSNSASLLWFTWYCNSNKIILVTWNNLEDITR